MAKIRPYHGSDYILGSPRFRNTYLGNLTDGLCEESRCILVLLQAMSAQSRCLFNTRLPWLLDCKKAVASVPVSLWPERHPKSISISNLGCGQYSVLCQLGPLKMHSAWLAEHSNAIAATTPEIYSTKAGSFSHFRVVTHGSTKAVHSFEAILLKPPTHLMK